jgi:hypothetical protein
MPRFDENTAFFGMRPATIIVGLDRIGMTDSRRSVGEGETLSSRPYRYDRRREVCELCEMVMLEQEQRTSG